MEAPAATMEPLEEVAGRGWLYWCPTSKAELRDAEKRMLSLVKTPFVQRMVPINGGQHQLNTIHTHPSPDKPPLVLVHGFGAGIGFWAKNLDELSLYYTVYAFDLLGFGRSSRPKFGERPPEEAERFWVDSIEEWRKQMGLEKFHLLGHSLGGYVTGCYALQHPDRVQHLILADPVGVPERPPEATPSRMNWKWRMLTNVAWRTSLLGPVRALGPWGPGIVQKMRGDLASKFSHSDSTVSDYLYHLIAQDASGEHVFTSLFEFPVYARRPLVSRLPELKVKDLTFIYGSETWMDPRPALAAKDLMKSHNVRFHLLPRAGHHVYADAPDEFHDVVVSCKDQVSPAAARPSAHPL